MLLDDTAYKFGAWALLTKLGVHPTNTLPPTRPVSHRGPDAHRAKDVSGMGPEGAEPFPVDSYGHPKLDTVKSAVLLGAQKPPKIEPFKLDKPVVPAESMEGQPQTMQPSQWDMQTKSPKELDNPFAKQLPKI